MVAVGPMDGAWLEVDMAWFGEEDDRGLQREEDDRGLEGVAVEGGSDYHVKIG